MFSTLLGPLPVDRDQTDAPDGDHDSASEGDAERQADLESTRRLDDVDALTGIGLELITDGGPPATPDDIPTAVVARWAAAAESTGATVKAVLTGPWTAARANGSAAEAEAERLGELLTALATAGCPIIEIAETDALDIATDPAAAREFAVAHRRLTDGLAGTHCSLALTGGNVDGVDPAILFDLPYASYAFDLIAGPDNWRLITRAPADRGIVCGALELAQGADRTRELLVWAAHYAAASNGRGLARVGLANAPGNGSLDRAETLRRLTIVAEASRIAAVESTEELVGLLDPRAIDPRSAAFGRFAPAKRRRAPGR